MTSYNQTGSIEMRPVFTSLGLPPSAFKQTQTRRTSPFDAGANCGGSYPDSVWLFRDSDTYRLNLRSGKLEEGPVPLRNIANNWPAVFESGIDAAVWGGPGYPHLHYFFRGNMVVKRTYNRDTGAARIDQGPITIPAAGFGSTRNTPLEQAVAYGFPSQDVPGKLFLGTGNQVVLHNLNTGKGFSNAQETLSTLFTLPQGWDKGIDLAFYGAGEESTILYLFSGMQVACYDPNSKKIVYCGNIPERFPALSRFLPTSQVFAVEEYCLLTFKGTPTKGSFVKEVSIMPRTRTKFKIVTETTTSASTQHSQSVLHNLSSESEKHLNDAVSQQQESQRSADSYRYDLNTSFHGDASASGVWGGEVNAALDVAGGSNDQRQRYADSTLSTVSSQAKQATQSVSTRVINDEETFQKTERVVSVMVQDVDNMSSDKALKTRFFKALEPALVVLSLTSVKVGYWDTERMRIVDISRARDLLTLGLVDSTSINNALNMLTAIYSRVLDYAGQPRQMVDNCGRSTDQRVRTRIEILNSGTNEPESFEVEGVAVRVQQIRVEGNELIIE